MNGTGRTVDPDPSITFGARLARSIERRDSAVTPTDRVPGWLAEHAAGATLEVERVPFDQLRNWRFDPHSGNLGHDSGRFFTVEGVDVETTDASWCQPIIVQPEIGVLGVLAREMDGCLHFLMQAKMEPGNRNVVQLSPTVQATRSNYKRVHGGSPVAFLDHFTREWSDRVVVDVLQSEQGSWFLHKRNRNMIVEIADEIDHDPGSFCWLTLGQIGELLGRDDVVNMDARTVLACMPLAARTDTAPWPAPTSGFGAAVLTSFRPEARPRHGMAELASWLTAQRATRTLVATRVPLHRGTDHGWRRGPDRIAHDSGRFFEVVAVDVAAGTREVATWTQPLLAPVGPGVLALVVRPIDGVLHALVQTRLDAGALGGAELAATVHCRPDNYADLPPERRPRFLDAVLEADPAAVRFDVMQSEEGGRFLAASHRYLVVEVGDDFPIGVPDEYRWMTFRQLAVFLRHGNQLTVELRTLLACLRTLV